jgi:hypothetical protein
VFLPPTPTIALCAQMQPLQNRLTVTYTLRFLTPSDFMAALKDKAVAAMLQSEGQWPAGDSPTLYPRGIDQFTASDTKNTLTVVATPSAHAALKQLLALLDVSPKMLEVRVRNKVAGKLALDSIASTSNHVPVGVNILSLAELERYQAERLNPCVNLKPVDPTILIVAHLNEDRKTVRFELQYHQQKTTVQTVPLGVLTPITLPPKLTLPDNQELFIYIQRINPDDF